MTLLQDGRDHLKTIHQVQEALAGEGVNPYEYIMWADQRELWSPTGSYVATPTQDGFRLDTIDRGTVLPRGLFADEESLVAAFLATAPLEPPMTEEQQVAARAAGRQASIESAAYRAGLEAEMWERFYERKRRRAAGEPVDQDGDSSGTRKDRL